MRVLALVSFVVSLVAATYFLVEVGSLRSEVARLQGEVDGLAIRPLEPRPRPPGEPAAAAPRAPAPAPLPAAQPADLGQRVSDLEDTVRGLLEGVARRGLLLPGALVLRELESTARVLDLDPAQQTALERARQEASERLRELYRLPNDQGLTWDAVADRRITAPTVGDAPSVTTGDAAALRAFEESRVPGTTESYAEARRRLVREGLQRLREQLKPGQQALFDLARADGLVDAAPGSAAPASGLPPTDAEGHSTPAPR